MATTPVLGNGPVRFTEASSGKQFSIPLADLYFDTNDQIQSDHWLPRSALSEPEQLDHWLRNLVKAGLLAQDNAAPAKRAMLIQAAREGSSGNNIQVEISNVVINPSDPTASAFEARVTETDTYT